MEPPEGCPPLAGRKGHACQCPPQPVFLSRQAPLARPGLRRKTPLHCARSGQPAGESAPRWGSFCAAAQHLTFLRCVPQAAQGARSRPGGRLVFCLCKKQGKKSTHKGVSPLWNPRKGARLWLGGRDTHVTARPDLFFAQTGPAHSTRAAPQNPTTLCPIGPACRGIRPALGFFLCSCAAPYLFEMCAAGGRGCPVPSGRTACFLLVQKAR